MSDLISLIAQRNAHASHRLLKTLKTFFRWCVGRAVIDFSPAEGISSPYREVSRDRVLTDQELAAVILAARRMPPPYGRIVEFLALTGQRREEVAQLKWDELDEKTRTWTIPGTRTKNKKVHIVHLSTPAWKVIEACSGEPYVFGTARGKRFQRFGREKHVIDKLCGITGWRLHDLRRTIVSEMARLGIPPHVADKILNHQAGTISGVAAVYQRHDFLAERKEALDRWGGHVGEIVQTEVRAADFLISGSKSPCAPTNYFNALSSIWLDRKPAVSARCPKSYCRSAGVPEGFGCAILQIKV